MRSLPVDMRISIEGNIGAGKSTAMSAVYGIAKFPEPIHDWKDWIQRLYEDEKKWSALFCINAIFSFGDADGVHERSPECSYEVFARSHVAAGKMTPMELELVQKCCSRAGWSPDAIIYLQTTPEFCHRNVVERGRAGENVTLEYLRTIHEAHETWISNAIISGRTVIIIDATKSAADVASEVVAAIEYLFGMRQL